MRDADRCRPIDLDQVSARLLGMPADGSTPPRACHPPAEEHPDYETRWYLDMITEGHQPLPHEIPPTDEELDMQRLREWRRLETEKYAWLVDEGGRPLYHIGLLDKVSTNPHEYHGMLRPWLQDPNSQSSQNWVTVFERQVTRWRGFLAWRKERRAIYDPNTEYSVFAERYRRDCVLHGDADHLDELEADPLSAWKHFDFMEKLRRSEQSRLLETRVKDGFSAHAEGMKQRLAEHGFTREFQLDEDLSRQDKLTTWIEYLYYEYSWYDVHAREGATRAVERQGILLQWVLEQVPQIEAELNASGMNGGGSHHGRSAKQRRRGRPTQRQPEDGQAPSLSGSTARRVSKRRQDEEPDDERPGKRLRADETRTGVPDVPGIPAARGKHLRASDEGQQSPVIPTPQPLRRSARIAAARQAPLKIASALPPAVKNPPRGRRQVATQAPRSSPRTRAAAQHSGSSAGKAAKRRRPGKPRPEGESKRQSSQRQRR